MADFRKWILAFAAAALVLATGTSAFAQTSPTFSCTASAANPPLVRAEGVTELVGDVVLSCTGGTPTPAGTPIPLSNISINLSANITDRVDAAGLAESLLVIDDAYPSAPYPTTAPRNPVSGTQLLCAANGGTHCDITSTGVASGIAGGDYDGTTGHFNVFQGIMSSPQQLTFLGVPIDAPGTTTTLTLRITNVRANASQLSVSGNFSLSPIQMFIAINGSQQVTINNPQPIVGYVSPGLSTAVVSATDEQCLPPANSFAVTFTEGFASSFKARVYGNGTAQNIPGFSYNSESGVWDVAGQQISSDSLADHGTRLLIRFSGFPAGVTLTVPNVVNLAGPGCAAWVNGANVAAGTCTASSVTGQAYYVTTDGYGNSAAGPTPVLSAGSQTVTLDSTGSGWATYEVLANDYTTTEEAYVPIGVTYPTTGQPALGTGSVKLSFAPIPAAGTTGWTVSEPATGYPLPRFVDTAVAANAFTVVPCTCNLLFPFVTNQAGFDTGIAIANTSMDPFGNTIQQSGPITLNYYGMPAQTAVTTPSVPAGCILTMTLSGGGSIMNCANAPTGTVAPAAGFQGYIIAQAQFQYCHGFAFITDVGAHNLAEGYLAIQLDIPGLNRTKQYGENEGN